jgi:hypothetical protein
MMKQLWNIASMLRITFRRSGMTTLEPPKLSSVTKKVFRVNWTRFFEADSWEEAKVLAENSGLIVDTIATQELLFVQSQRKDVLLWIQKYRRPGCLMY